MSDSLRKTTFKTKVFTLIGLLTLVVLSTPTLAEAKQHSKQEAAASYPKRDTATKSTAGNRGVQTRRLDLGQSAVPGPLPSSTVTTDTTASGFLVAAVLGFFALLWVLVLRRAARTTGVARATRVKAAWGTGGGRETHIPRP